MNNDGIALSSQMIVELMFSNSPIGGANGQLETVNDSLLWWIWTWGNYSNEDHGMWPKSERILGLECADGNDDRNPALTVKI